MRSSATASPARPARAQSPSRAALRTLLLTCVATIAFWFLPGVSVILYPIRLFVTFIHEGGHAFATYLTGGSVGDILIFPNASGLTMCFGGNGPLISVAGYLGATLYGAVLITLGRRPGFARAALGVSAIWIAYLTIFHVRFWNDLFGSIWGIAIALGIGLAAIRLSPRAAELLSMFLGVQAAINALYDLRTLIGLSSMPIGPDTDAVNMSRIVPLPPIVWALLWTMMSLAILIVAIKPYWKDALQAARTLGA